MTDATQSPAIDCSLTTGDLIRQVKAMSVDELYEELKPIAPIEQGWGIEVKVRTSYTNGDPVLEWRRLRPTNGPAYVYNTKEAAEHIGRICYGQDAEWRAVQL